ncbi:extracellular solute-binding protein [Martelella alba]|uniref:ABC transporter substrate-binding protein n=1 Tax=Martelella alba TaxID=2590451 RepID=A0ABY2SLF5_9HYPH|nr:extracellular solute-binding protein [Martelella alba]TKI05830.1 ABC transporter substrate-binding protein [Martelella alba]
MFLRFWIALAFSMSCFGLQAETINEGYAFALLGEPKYASDFTHFDYVNPAAPKGGSVTLAVIGTFDNFNRYALRGTAAARTEQLYDSLFTTSDDEMGSYYPLVADTVRYPTDLKWIEVTLNPRARYHNHQPITARDVVFTFNKFMTEGVPQFRLYYKGVTAKVIAPLTVRFDFPQPDKEKMLGLLSLPILPESFWRHHKLSEPLTAPPPSSGPYRITAWRTGQYVTYSRVKDYWAENLPVNRGRNNFDKIRYDYYLDDNVALEAFKAGAYDLRVEQSPKNWATQYHGGNFDRGYIIKQEIPNNAPVDTNWLAFNIQRPMFADRRVREAISLAFDFEWMNKALFYNGYQRVNSYFINTDYAARGYPDAAELAWLAPLKGQIPPDVFTSIYQPPTSDGSGYDRANLLKALALLKQAGWELRDGKLVNVKTGQPFRFEMMLMSGGNSQYILPFQHNLQRLGIDMTIREVDSAQFINRLRKRDFDMMPASYSAFSYPSGDLQIVWGSAYVDSTYNRPGVKDPAIDRLINEIVRHQGDKPALLSLGRALDRVLTWNYYMIPLWYSPQIRLAYWDKFAMPEIRPTYALGFDTWWYDVNRAANLPAERR